MQKTSPALAFLSRFLTIPTIVVGFAMSSAASAQQPRIDWVAPEEGILLNSLPEFRTGAQTRVVFTDRWQQEEYALFQNDGAQSEMIMTIASERDLIALEYSLTVRRNIESWNLNQHYPIQYRDKGRIDSLLDTFFYERYTLGGVNRNCVGYYTTWDDHVEDYQGRPAKAVFGYYCAKAGVEISNAKIEEIVDSLGFRSAHDYARFQPAPPKMKTAAVNGVSPKAFANGSSANTGNQNFPFDMAVLIDEVEGDDRNR